MADFDGIISPSPDWADIPSLAKDAVALGGASGAGAMNAQAVALTKRTNYLINYSVQISPVTGRAGIGTSSPIGRLQIGDATVNADNKIVFGKAQSASESKLPVIGHRSTGVGNDLVLASTSAGGSVKIFTGDATNSGEIGTGSNSEKFRVESSGYVTANGPAARIAVSPATATNNAFTQFTNTGGIGYVGLDNSAGALTGSVYSLGLWHSGNYQIRFGTNNILRAYFGTDGIFNRMVSASSGAETVGIRFTDGTSNLGSIRSYSNGSNNQQVRIYSSNAGSETLAISAIENGDTRIHKNLGISDAASTSWNTSYAAVQLKTHTSMYNSGGAATSGFGTNFYVNTSSSSIFTKADYSAAYEQQSGNHVWFVSSAVGAVGGTVSWIQNMKLTAGGILGVGVNPSAWGTSQRAIEIGYSGALKCSSAASAVLSLTNNAYYTTNWLYKNSSMAAASYEQRETGEHRWYIAPSGTAGATISWTQAMTLDTSGNLIVGSSSAILSSGGRGNITINGSISSILSLGVGGTSSSYLYSYGNDWDIWNSRNGYTRFGTNNVERMRIDASGWSAFYQGGSTIYLGSGAVGDGTTNDSVIRWDATGALKICKSTATVAQFANTGDLELKTPGYLKIPEGTTAQRPASPQEGMIRKNSTLNVIEGYSGGSYVSLEAGRLINVRLFTNKGVHSSFNLDPKTNYIIVEMIGGGGGGATKQAGPYATDTFVAVGSSGGTGGAVKFLIQKANLQSTFYYYIGEGGAPGTPGSGSAGQTSYFSTTSTSSLGANYIAATGGGGGLVAGPSYAPMSVSGGDGGGYTRAGTLVAGSTILEAAAKKGYRISQVYANAHGTILSDTPFYDMFQQHPAPWSWAGTELSLDGGTAFSFGAGGAGSFGYRNDGQGSNYSVTGYSGFQGMLRVYEYS